MAASIGIKTQACRLCRIPSVVVRKTTKSRCFLRKCSSSTISPREADIDPAALSAMEKRGVSFKGHPGIMKLKPINIPERLERAVQTVITKYPVPELDKRSEQLNNYLMSRHPPAEDKQLRQAAENMYEDILTSENLDTSSMSKEEQQQHLQDNKSRVMKKLRSNQYHWKPMVFDAPSSVVYLKARLAYNYSSLMQCFSEIHRREPDFHPRAMFDLGSGLGSSVWAGNKVWGSLLFEYYCVDPSRDMNTLARLLLQDGDEQKAMNVRGVHFRQFAPSHVENKFCLVVCGHTLLELPGQRERLDTVAALWQMAQDYLVLVENGTTAGFSVLNEAKEHLLKLSDERGGEFTGHVFAPCPHDEACPKLIERKSPCFFKVTYKPGVVLSGKESKQSSRYSYVILKKGKRQEEDVRWPRVIQEVTKASRHVHCHLCCPDATISHSIFTQKRHGKNIYKCSRHSNWGDMLPIVLPNSTSNKTDSTSGDCEDTDNLKPQTVHSSENIHLSCEDDLTNNHPTDNSPALL